MTWPSHIGLDVHDLDGKFLPSESPLEPSTDEDDDPFAVWDDDIRVDDEFGGVGFYPWERW